MLLKPYQRITGSVIICLLLLISCNKKDLTPPVNWAERVAGTYNWKRYHYQSWGPNAAVTILQDTTFDIVAINDSTINVFAQKLSLFNGYRLSSDSTKVMFWPLGEISPYMSNIWSLQYDYSNDSLYLKNDESGLGGQFYTKYYTKK